LKFEVFSFPPALSGEGERLERVPIPEGTVRFHEDLTVIFLGFAASAFGSTSLSTPSFIDA